MRFVVGLGNPGPEYEGTRHNAGFEVVERLAARLRLEFRRRGLDALVADGRERREGGCVLVKPTSYMNRSGGPLKRILHELSGGPDEALVVVDDFQLELGRLRVRGEGSDGGHNGLRSVIASLGTQAFPRLRVGIGAPPERIPAEVYVLQRFRPVERKEIEEALERAADAAHDWADGADAKDLMNRYNGA